MRILAWTTPGFPILCVARGMSAGFVTSPRYRAGAWSRPENSPEPAPAPRCKTVTAPVPIGKTVETYSVGFRFNDGGGQQYGWARIRWGGCPANDFIVKDYAWGDIGDQIKTGQRQLHEDETQVAPQAAKSADAPPLADSWGSLGLLALGAVGLQAWRAKRVE
jgi:hypothetical protein